MDIREKMHNVYQDPLLPRQNRECKYIPWLDKIYNGKSQRQKEA